MHTWLHQLYPAWIRLIYIPRFFYLKISCSSSNWLLHKPPSSPPILPLLQSVVAGVGRLLQRGLGRIGVLWVGERSTRSLQREASKAGLVITLLRQVTDHASSPQQQHVSPQQHHISPQQQQRTTESPHPPIAQQLLDFAQDNAMVIMALSLFYFVVVRWWPLRNHRVGYRLECSFWWYNWCSGSPL